MALMNELALIYSADNICITDVIAAASTKWNFAPFSPGLVGGHCIAVDPHYLIHRARQLKVGASLVATAQATNDGFASALGRCCNAVAVERMGPDCDRVVAVLVLGLTYKPGASDSRESRSFDVVRALRGVGADVDAFDPHANAVSASAQLELCGARLVQPEELSARGAHYDVVLVCVAHEEFKVPTAALSRFLRRSRSSFIADPFGALRPACGASGPSSSKGTVLIGLIEPDFLHVSRKEWVQQGDPATDEMAPAALPQPPPSQLQPPSQIEPRLSALQDARNANILIIGYGRIGARHAAIASALRGCTLVGICDPDGVALERALHAHPDVQRYSDPAVALSACGCTVVAVCTPNDLHAPMALQALASGRHVVVEKPIALFASDVRKVEEAAACTGCHVFCVMQNRYSPTSTWLKEVVQSGRLGQVRFAQMNCFWNRTAEYFRQSAWRGTLLSDGGPLYTQFSHFLDLLLWTLGDISDVVARFANLSQQCECEDAGCVSFNLVGGGIGTFSYATCAYKRNIESSLTLLCEHGTIKVGGQYMERVELCDIEGYTMPELPPAEPPNDYGTYTGSAAAHHFVYQNVCAVLSGGTGPDTSVRDGLQLVQTIEDVYRQRPLPLLPPPPPSMATREAMPASHQSERVEMVDLRRLNERHRLSVAALAPSVEACRFVLGPNVLAFEKELGSLLDVAHVVGCGCGTDALTMAMMALGLKPGDEVITPSHTFVAAVEAIVRMGCIPVYVDVDPTTFLMGAACVRAAATVATKAVIAVHLYGQACDIEPIFDACRRLGLFLIEDTAQALGSVCSMADGRRVRAGTIGDIGTTSFYPSKPLGGWGDGGACFTASDELGAQLRAIRNHGITRKKYEYEIVGVNSRLDDLQACVLRRKLPYLDADAEARARIAALYDRHFTNLPLVTTPARRVGSTHVWHQVCHSAVTRTRAAPHLKVGRFHDWRLLLHDSTRSR
jgi:dTDP-4-amino-4,6-dideoxygalactose transaminase/predicted dehydrogenase